MPEASIRGARDPERNKDDHYEAFDQGMAALVRALVKFERWEELLKPGAIPWRELPSDKNLRAFAETMAYIGQGKLVDARFRLSEWKASMKEQEEKGKDKDKDMGSPSAAGTPDRMNAVEGLLHAAEGDLIEGTRLLGDAVAGEQKMRDAGAYTSDPPDDPWPASRKLGDVYLKHKDYELAIDACAGAAVHLPTMRTRGVLPLMTTSKSWNCTPRSHHAGLQLGLDRHRRRYVDPLDVPEERQECLIPPGRSHRRNLGFQNERGLTIRFAGHGSRSSGENEEAVPAQGVLSESVLPAKTVTGRPRTAAHAEFAGDNETTSTRQCGRTPRGRSRDRATSRDSGRSQQMLGRILPQRLDNAYGGHRLALFLSKHVARRVIFWVMPIAGDGTAPGFAINVAHLAVMAVGLALSLRKRVELPAATPS